MSTPARNPVNWLLVLACTTLMLVSVAASIYIARSGRDEVQRVGKEADFQRWKKEREAEDVEEKRKFDALSPKNKYDTLMIRWANMKEGNEKEKVSKQIDEIGKQLR